MCHVAVTELADQKAQKKPFTAAGAMGIIKSMLGINQSCKWIFKVAGTVDSAAAAAEAAAVTQAHPHPHPSIKDDQSNCCQHRRTQLAMSWMLPLAVARWRVEQGQCRCRRLTELSLAPHNSPFPVPPAPSAPLTSANGQTSPFARKLLSQNCRWSGWAWRRIW